MGTIIRTVIIAAVSLIALGGAPVLAAPCRGAHGKFVKCLPKAAAPATRCKDGKGRFTKCSAAPVQAIVKSSGERGG